MTTLLWAVKIALIVLVGVPLLAYILTALAGGYRYYKVMKNFSQTMAKEDSSISLWRDISREIHEAKPPAESGATFTSGFYAGTKYSMDAISKNLKEKYGYDQK